MFADRLGKAWNTRRGSTAIEPVMRFTDEGLVLGAGTVLAKSSGSCRAISIDPRDQRLQALLAAAHLQKPVFGALAHLSKAAERWREGEDALAAMHLALSRLDRLGQPKADAYRMFLAERLLNDGIDAGGVIKAATLGGAAFEQFGKYDPDQPRVPAGSGKTSGQWTSGDDGSPSQPEVNPNTITPAADHPYRGDDACYRAKRDCYEAAVEAAQGDHANDNYNVNDFLDCEGAETACEILGAVIERVPLLDRGGVIFPHKGVVIIEKGQEDLYIPPIARGRIPPFRRSV